MKKILVIDSDYSFCNFVKKNLEIFGEFKVLSANDANSGVKMAKQEKPDLILLDLIMPGIGGDEAKRILQEDQATANIPVIFLTNIIDKSDTSGDVITESGGNKFLSKPISSEKLFKAVDRVLGKK